MSKLKKLGVFALSLALAFCFAACGDKPEEQPGDTVDYAAAQQAANTKLLSLSDEEFTRAQLIGTDSLGRTVSPVVDFNDKYVGLFYFVATGYLYPDTNRTNYNIYDISKLLEKYPDRTVNTSPITALPLDYPEVNCFTSQYYNANEAPEGQSYFWGEPLYGYYRSDDPWVIRKHLELFMNAGIDFLYLDFTNHVYYPETTKILLNVIKEMQAEGYNPPRVTFFLNVTDPGGLAYTFDIVLRNFFYTDEFKSCWFYADESMNPEQKPLIVGNFDNLSDKNGDGWVYADHLWMVPEQWPERQILEDAIPWMDKYQHLHTGLGVMNVSVSQGGEASSEAYYNKSTVYRARGYDLNKPNAHGYEDEGVLAGVNFGQQWDNAIAHKDELNMVTVTGWNEWIVTKLPNNDPASQHKGRGCFVDSFNMAYSRDIEMMKGGYGDNYYMQLAENIRRFKGVTVEHSDNVLSVEKKTVSSLTDMSIWDTARKYLDMGLATVERDHTSVDRNIAYTDTTNRNDIEYVQMCNDGDNLYVAVTCREDVKMPAGSDTDKNNWMNLYLSCGGAGWEGYDFIVRGTPAQSGEMDIMALDSKGEASAKGKAQFAVSGKTVVYSIPLSTLGASENQVIGIKSADNLQKVCDADEFMLHGDCAPMGRLNYAYKIA